MTIVGTFPEHHPDSAIEANFGDFSVGERGDTNYDELLDIAAYFVVGHNSRGLPMGSAVIGMTVEKDDTGMKTWNFILPSSHEPVNSAVGRRVGITFTEIADEGRTVFADRSQLTFSHTTGQKRLEGFEPLDKIDYKELGFVKDALEHWLLGDRRPQVVPDTKLS